MSVKKSPRIQKLVVNAIRKLQDVQGSTPREISNYISQEYDVPSTKIQRQVRVALARAVSYGILQRSKGGFYACNREVIGCQPQLETAQPTDKCGHRRVRMRRGKSCGKSARRRKRGGGSCGKGGGRRRRGGGRRSRKRSRRRGGGKCGGGRKSRRRRGGRRRGRGRSACCGGGGGGKRRRRSGRRRSRGGKKCASGNERGGNTGDERGIFSSGGKRRQARRSISNARNDNRDRSGSPSVSDEERLDGKRSNEPIESPEISLD